MDHCLPGGSWEAELLKPVLDDDAVRVAFLAF